MRRGMSLLCIMLLLAGTVLAAEESVPEAYAPGVGYENLVSTDIYDQPNADAEIAGHLATGEIVTVLDNQGDWVRVESVRANGTAVTGWLLRSGIGRLGSNMPYFGTAVVANPNPADRLNLREGPGQEYPTLGLYYNGVEVACWSDPAQGEWVLVTIGQVAGYMRRAYLRLSKDGTVEPATPLLVVSNQEAGTGLNLREAPDMEAAVLDTYPHGQQVRVLGVQGDWVHVKVDDKSEGERSEPSGEDRPEASADAKPALAEGSSVGRTGYMLRSFLLRYDGTEATMPPEVPELPGETPRLVTETPLPMAESVPPLKTGGKGAEGYRYVEGEYTLVAAVSELQDGRLYAHAILSYDLAYAGQRDIAALRLYLNGQEAALLEAYAEGNANLEDPAGGAFRSTFAWPEGMVSARIVPVGGEGAEMVAETLELAVR